MVITQVCATWWGSILKNSLERRKRPAWNSLASTFRFDWWVFRSEFRFQQFKALRQQPLSCKLGRVSAIREDGSEISGWLCRAPGSGGQCLWLLEGIVQNERVQYRDLNSCPYHFENKKQISRTIATLGISDHTIVNCRSVTYVRSFHGTAAA